MLLARHGVTLPADSLERLMRRTEGWAAGLRLAAMSMGTHPDPDQFVNDLITEDSALTGYLVEEVLKAAPPEAREMLLSTSILERVNAEAASELTGNEQAGTILSAVARANAFVQPTGCGWYRYHTLFAEVLRLKLRREYPDRVAAVHRRAAWWYERNHMLTAAVRHAAAAGDWQLAAGMVIDGLAISEIIEPRDGQCLAGEFAGMPRGEAWTGAEPYLVAAAVALSAGRGESCTAALDAAEGILGRLPAGQEAAARLAAVVIRLAASRSAGDLAEAAAAVRVEALVSQMPDGELAQHPKSGRGRCPAAGPSSCGGAISARRPASSMRAWPPRPVRRRARMSRLPRATGPGGGLARPAAPRCQAGRPGHGGRGRRSSGRLLGTGPRGARRARLGTPGTGRPAGSGQVAQATGRRPRCKPGQADEGGGLPDSGVWWTG